MVTPATPVPPRAARAWRWIALAAVVGNVLFNYLYDRLRTGPNMKVVADRYDSLFTPPPYTFAIWGVIYLGFVVFTVCGLRPSQRATPAYDRLASLLALANLLASFWIIVFTHDQVRPSVPILAATLVVAAMLYGRAHVERIRGRMPWLRAPFSLFLGWVMCAVLANLAAALTSSGVVVTPVVASLMVAAATIAALILCARFRDPLVPAVVTWALVAIASRGTSIELVAISGAVVCALATIGMATLRLRVPATSGGLT